MHPKKLKTAPMSHIGQSVETISKFQGAIMAVLGSNKDNKTLRKALDVLAKGLVVKNVTVSDCTFSGE